jgi:hypothetical protein
MSWILLPKIVLVANFTKENYKNKIFMSISLLLEKDVLLGYIYTSDFLHAT